MNRAILEKMTGGAFSEEEMDFALERARDYILAYCNLSSVPEALRSILRQMAADFLNSGKVSADALHSVTLGDARVEFETAEKPDVIFSRYRSILNRYRKVRFS